MGGREQGFAFFEETEQG